MIRTFITRNHYTPGTRVKALGTRKRIGICLMRKSNYSQDHFLGGRADIVHHSNPAQLIFGFQPFRHALSLRHVLYKPFHHLACGLVDFLKVACQLIRQYKLRIKHLPVLFQIPPSHSAIPADVRAGWGSKAGVIIVPDELVADTCSFVFDEAFHCAFSFAFLS